MESAPDAKFDASTFFLFSHLTHLTAQCSSLTNSPTRGNAGNANDFRTPPALEQHRNYRVGNRRAPTPKQKKSTIGSEIVYAGGQNHLPAKPLPVPVGFEVVRRPVEVAWGRFGTGFGLLGPQAVTKSTPTGPFTCKATPGPRWQIAATWIEPINS